MEMNVAGGLEEHWSGDGKTRTRGKDKEVSKSLSVVLRG